jgi:small subunit ribosomal protein S20
MANTKSAVKRLRQSLLNRQRNRRIKSHIKKAEKNFFLLLEENNKDKAREAYFSASRVIDKVVSKGIIHKNTGARKKSRLSQKLNKQVG